MASAPSPLGLRIPSAAGARQPQRVVVCREDAVWGCSVTNPSLRRLRPQKLPASFTSAYLQHPERPKAAVT